MTGMQLADREPEALGALVARAEAISLQLGSWMADPERQPQPQLTDQLRAMQAIELHAAQQLSASVEGRDEQLALALRAVVMAMTQRQQHHGRLAKAADAELGRCSLQVTACADRTLKGLVAAQWAVGDGEDAGDGETGGAIGRLVQALVRLVGVGCEPSLWAPLQNTAWAKLTALREAGALGHANPRGQELRQSIGAELIKRIGERQRLISQLATAGGEVNASAEGIERPAKVLRFFATKGVGLVPSQPFTLVEGLLGIAAETLCVSWHEPKAGGAPSSLAMAEKALVDMLVSLGAELPADDRGVEVLAALASWFAEGGNQASALGVLLCLVRLLPLTSSWAAAQQLSAARPLMQLARAAVHRLCGLAGDKRGGTDGFGALFEEVCGSLARWAATIPLLHQPQLQLLLLEMFLAPASGGCAEAEAAAEYPQMAAVVLSVWDTTLRSVEDARVLHAHAQTLIHLAAGGGPMLPSLQVAATGLLASICGRLSAAAGGGGAAGDGDPAALRELLGSLAETVRGGVGGDGSGAGVGLILPAVLQPPSTSALRLLQDITAEIQAAAETQQQQQQQQQGQSSIDPELMAKLGRILSVVAAAVAADAAPLSGGEAQLTVLRNALQLLKRHPTAITPSAVDGTAALLR